MKATFYGLLPAVDPLCYNIDNAMVLTILLTNKWSVRTNQFDILLGLSVHGTPTSFQKRFSIQVCKHASVQM